MKVELSKAELLYLMQVITNDINELNNASWVLAAELRDRLYSYQEE